MKITAFYVCWDKRRECWMFRTVPFEATGFWCRVPGELKGHQRGNSPGRDELKVTRARELLLGWMKDRTNDDGCILTVEPTVEIRMRGTCTIESAFKPDFTGE